MTLHDILGPLGLDAAAFAGPADGGIVVTSPIDGSFIEFALDYPEHTALLQFVRDHPFLFNGEPYAKVGALYSFPSDYHHFVRNRWGGVAFALLDGHVQFDALSLGDNRFMADTFADRDLSDYDALLMPWSKSCPTVRSRNCSISLKAVARS